jgi:hypothetical protein
MSFFKLTDESHFTDVVLGSYPVSYFEELGQEIPRWSFCHNPKIADSVHHAIL